MKTQGHFSAAINMLRFQRPAVPDTCAYDVMQPIIVECLSSRRRDHSDQSNRRFKPGISDAASCCPEPSDTVQASVPDLLAVLVHHQPLLKLAPMNRRSMEKEIPKLQFCQIGARDWVANEQDALPLPGRLCREAMSRVDACDMASHRLC